MLLCCAGDSAGQLQFLLWDAHPVDHKAEREFGYASSPLEAGVPQTVEWILSTQGMK
jgi:hypothetical protein